METLPLDYLAEIARQIAFLSAFLGGFAATFLATLLMVDSPRKVAGWAIGAAAFAATLFIVAVIASVMLAVVLQPNVPERVASVASIGHARTVSGAGFILGLYALLLSLGLSGWIRSRGVGIATALAAGLGAVMVTWGLTGFG